jgi:hypothetical protein
VALVRRRLLWGVWVAMSALMMLVTLVEVRYFLQVLPLLLYGCWLMLAWLDRRLAGRGGWVSAAPMALFVAMVAVNAGRAATLVVEQRGVPFLKSYRHGKYALVPELTRLLQAQTPDGAWVLVPERQLGRILTFLSRRYAVEPGPVTQLNPEIQTVFVLEPLEEDSLRWMDILRLGVGGPVGPEVKGGRGKAWQLHHATRLPPATAPAAPPSPGARSVPAGTREMAHPRFEHALTPALSRGERGKHFVIPTSYRRSASFLPLPPGEGGGEGALEPAGRSFAAPSTASHDLARETAKHAQGAGSS